MWVTARLLAARPALVLWVVSPLSLSACRTVASTASVTAEQEVIRAEHDWVDVTLKHDADAFASFLHDAWVGLTSRGTWSTKASWTASIRSVAAHDDAVELSNLRVRFPRPDVAVVTGDFTQRGGLTGRDGTTGGRYVNTWARVGGRWELVASGFASVPTPPPLARGSNGVGPEPAHGGRFIRPAEAPTVQFCASPGLTVRLLLDSATVGAARFAVGTAAVAPGGANAGTHPSEDEATYFLRGEGRAFVGPDTVTVQPGLVLYVPRGVRHGFVSTGSTPLEFFWVVSPPSLAARFRAAGVPVGTACPTRAP